MLRNLLLNLAAPYVTETAMFFLSLILDCVAELDASQGPRSISVPKAKHGPALNAECNGRQGSGKDNMAKLSKAEQELLDSMDRQREVAAGRKRVRSRPVTAVFSFCVMLLAAHQFTWVLPRVRPRARASRSARARGSCLGQRSERLTWWKSLGECRHHHGRPCACTSMRH